MQEQFTILSGGEVDAQGRTLAIQLGEDYFAYAIHNPAENFLEELRWFSADKWHPQQLDTILKSNPILQQPFDKIVAGFDYDTFSLLPPEYNNGDHSLLMHLNGADPQDHIMYETIAHPDMTTVYTIPYNILNWCTENFYAAQYWHMQTVLIKNVVSANTEERIAVNISAKKFTATVVKENRLLLSQSYVYTTPGDVLFYLLKICEVFHLSQETVQIAISGLVDEQSALYKELYDYFLHVQFVCPQWLIPENIDYPGHYFTTLNQLMLCES